MTQTASNKLDFDSFMRGMQLLNAMSVNQITADSTFDTYYLLLSECEPQIFINSIIILLKSKINMYNPPSAGEILKYYKEEEARVFNFDVIVNQILNDVSIFGITKKPKYTPLIESAIINSGGWNSICKNSLNIDSFKQNLKESSNKLITFS